MCSSLIVILNLRSTEAKQVRLWSLVTKKHVTHARFAFFRCMVHLKLIAVTYLSAKYSSNPMYHITLQQAFQPVGYPPSREISASENTENMLSVYLLNFIATKAHSLCTMIRWHSTVLRISAQSMPGLFLDSEREGRTAVFVNVVGALGSTQRPA